MSNGMYGQHELVAAISQITVSWCFDLTNFIYSFFLGKIILKIMFRSFLDIRMGKTGSLGP